METSPEARFRTAEKERREVWAGAGNDSSPAHHGFTTGEDGVQEGGGMKMKLEDREQTEDRSGWVNRWMEGGRSGTRVNR